METKPISDFETLRLTIISVNNGEAITKSEWLKE